MGSVLCEHCTAACCRYIALPIDTPETARDFEDMRWYVLHENIAVFVEEGDWYIQIQARCREIQPDGRCGTYETRPPICREYTTNECDYHPGEEFNGAYFDNPDDLSVFAREYLRALRPKSGGKRNGKLGARPRKRRSATAGPDKRVPRRSRMQSPTLVSIGLPTAGK